MKPIKFSYGVIHFSKYMKNENVNFGQCVMHRTKESRNNSNSRDWSHKRTDLNVVDDCSRCGKFNDLSNNHQWNI